MDAFLRSASRHGAAARASTAGALPEITIRRAYADDHLPLIRLAALDSAEVPPAPLLIAEIDGELRVALSLQDGSVIADPFVATADYIELLRTRAELRRPRRAERLRARLRRSRAYRAPSPPRAQATHP
jgi:hypothetical protein